MNDLRILPAHQKKDQRFCIICLQVLNSRTEFSALMPEFEPREHHISADGGQHVQHGSGCTPSRGPGLRERQRRQIHRRPRMSPDQPARAPPIPVKPRSTRQAVVSPLSGFCCGDTAEKQRMRDQWVWWEVSMRVAHQKMPSQHAANEATLPVPAVSDGPRTRTTSSARVAMYRCASAGVAQGGAVSELQARTVFQQACTSGHRIDTQVHLKVIICYFAACPERS
jgi:hypothetical protein